MEQRLRRARGEDVDDDDDIDDGPTILRRPDLYAAPRGSAGGSGGCAQAILYLVIGGVVALLILLFAGDRLLGRVGEALNPARNVGALVASPTPTIVDRGATVRQIQGLSRLETARYSIETVIEAGVEGNAFQNLLFGDKLLLIAAGNVTAGVDLSKLQEQDVQMSADGKQIVVTLPPSEIFAASLDEQRTRVYDREQGFLASQNQDLETEARRAAQARILQAACDDNVMQTAAEESQQSVERLLRLAGFEQVEVRTQAGPCTAPGEPPAVPAPTTTQ